MSAAVNSRLLEISAPIRRCADRNMPAGITLKPVSSYFWGPWRNPAPRVRPGVRNAPSDTVIR
jgi:hypothetical protein